MKSITVDFTQPLRLGLVRANLARSPETIELGDTVEAVDPSEGMMFTGMVVKIEDGYAYLMMDWE